MQRTILFVRHGETSYNLERRYQGQTDIPLNQQGREQARQLRQRLEKHAHYFSLEHTRVISSDLGRARETAELALGLPERQIEIDPALREVRFGVFEGLTRPEIDEKYPTVMEAWLHGDDDYVIKGGESRAQVKARSYAALDRLIASFAEPHLVVVSHGGVLRQLLRRPFQGEDNWRLSYHNCAAHLVHVEGERWTYGGEL